MKQTTLEKQIASVAEGRTNIVDLRTDRGNLVLLSERLGERFRPILELMAEQITAENASERVDNLWTDEKNRRRIALIDKKYDSSLTAAEKRELKQLQDESERFANNIAQPRNAVLELLLLGLEHKLALKIRR